MKINLTPTELIDQLRAWFHPKDRAVVIPTTLTAVAISGGATLATALIQEQILTANATNITFASIPQNFRSLIIIGQLRSSAAVEIDNFFLRFNGDASASYDIIVTRASVAGTVIAVARAATALTIGNSDAANSRASNFSPFTVEIPGYALSDREKWAYCSNSGAFGDVSADTDLYLDNRRGRWRSTAVIKAITIMPNTGNFVSGSRATLYGLL